MKKKMWDWIDRHSVSLIATSAAISLLFALASFAPSTMHAQTTAPSPSFRGYHIASNGTFVVSSTAGLLNTIVINTSGASSNTISVYDGAAATGQLLAVINGTMLPNYLQYNIQYVTNLTIVSATGTAAASL